MITKKELESLKKNQEYINSEKERILSLIEQTQKITSSYSNLPRIKSQIYDRMAENLAKLLDIQNKTLESVINMEKKVIHIKKEIEKLEPKYRNILYKYYVLGKSLVTIASEENYGYEWICRIHGQALQMLKNK